MRVAMNLRQLRSLESGKAGPSSKAPEFPGRSSRCAKCHCASFPGSNPGKRSRRTNGQQYFPEKNWVPLNGAVVGWCLLTRFCPNTLQIFRSCTDPLFPASIAIASSVDVLSQHHQNTTQEYRNSGKVVQIENGFSKICRTQVRKQCQTPLQVDYALCRWTMH